MAGCESKQNAMEKIDEFVNEENKIVIYKWLSRTLSIDVDTAKYYLYCFIEENKSKYVMNICYLLSGIQEKANNIKIHKVIVTSQDKLEESKSLFSSVTSFHVYSIQLSKIQDSSVLYTAEVVSNRKLEDQQKYSAVKYDNVRILPKRNFETKASDKIQTITKCQKEPVKLQPPPPKQKQNGLFGLWQKQQSNSEKFEKKEKEIKPLKLSAVENKEEKINNNGIKQLPPHQENSIDIKKPSCKKKDFGTKKSPLRENDKDEGNITSKLTKHRRKQDKEHRLSSKEEIAKLPNKKRHKRILQISDSESESEDELPDEDFTFQTKKLKICEESLEESPLEENDESPLEENEESLIPPTDNSTVCYKTVNKTYVDEHGFMVTKKIKECIRESPQKEDQTPFQEKNSTSKDTIKIVPSENLNHVQKKQASLMNFFMKK